MGGGASVHKRRDNSDSSNGSSHRGSSSQKQSKSGFRIRKRKQKETNSTSGLSRSHQGSMGKLERGKLILVDFNSSVLTTSYIHPFPPYI